MLQHNHQRIARSYPGNMIQDHDEGEKRREYSVSPAMDAANSRHFFMSETTENTANNRSILTIAHMIKTVMYSATE